jgi:hypothetical protein
LSGATGPCIFEVFLEPTYPFFVKAFGKLDDLLDQAGEDRITVKLYLQSQPWHMYSGVLVERQKRQRPRFWRKLPSQRLLALACLHLSEK